jgi:hypothetical protein
MPFSLPKDVLIMLLDEPVRLNLAADEAIVLLWYLSRELWNCNGERLATSTDHPAEIHALHALLQELIGPLMWTGDPSKGDEIIRAARESLIARHT